MDENGFAGCAAALEGSVEVAGAITVIGGFRRIRGGCCGFMRGAEDDDADARGDIPLRVGLSALGLLAALGLLVAFGLSLTVFPCSLLFVCSFPFTGSFSPFTRSVSSFP